MEVICISSSPPTCPNKTKAWQPQRTAEPSKSLADLFPLEDFDTTGELDFPNGRPTKKRRSHSPERRTSRLPRDVDAELTLSSDLDVPSSSAPVQNITRGPVSRPVHVFDDIEFSSSAPLPGPSRTSPEDVQLLSSDSITAGDSLPTARAAFSSLVMNVLNTATAVDDRARARSSVPGRKLARSNSGRQLGSKQDRVDADAIEFSSQLPVASQKTSSKSKIATTDALTSKEAKRAAKELDQQFRQEARLERDKEKQKARDMAEVNKSKANKKDTAKEMILEMPEVLEALSIGNQVEEYMRQHEVRVVFKRDEITLGEDQWLHLGNIVQWKRKIEAIYDENEGQWRPIDKPRIETEPHVAVLLNGLDFASIAVGAIEQPSLSSMKENFDRHITTLRGRFPKRRLIYIIQGLNAWIKKNENTKNREYSAAVRAEVAEECAYQPKKRKQTKTAPRHLFAVTHDVVEDLQLHLQVNHQPLVIHHTTSDASTASQILSFTQSLSTRPYRIAELEHNLKSASFYMGSGQFKTGDDARETFARMLEEQQRVTPSIAQSIVAQYSSPRELVAAFRRNDNMMLENMRKSTNKDGGYSDKRIGPVISKRMHKVFLGRDPEATSGMS